RARQVHLGFPEARERLRVGPRTAVFALGNPIRVPEPGSRHAALVELGLLPTRPTLLVFGGSQGARAINYAVAGALERRLPDAVNVVWGTGTAHLPALTSSSSRRSSARSEEHTSELQSLGHLVCRLLLQKKTKAS